MIEAKDLLLFSFADDYEELWTTLIKRGLVEHTPENAQPKPPDGRTPTP